VAARGLKTWVCGRNLAGITGSNPTGWMVVCLLCVCCALQGRGLCIALITCSYEVFREWCVWVWSRNLNNRRSRPSIALETGEKNEHTHTISWHRCVVMSPTCDPQYRMCYNQFLVILSVISFSVSMKHEFEKKYDTVLPWATLVCFIFSQPTH